MTGRVLALDWGDRRIGVALSDLMKITAQPIKTIHYKGQHELKTVFTEIFEMIQNESVETIVSGLPVNMNGSEGPRVQKTKDLVLRFQKFLKKNNFDFESLNWVYWDERLSTSGAERVLLQADVSRKKRKNVIDKMASVFILQGYLESLREDDFYL